MAGQRSLAAIRHRMITPPNELSHTIEFPSPSSSTYEISLQLLKVFASGILSSLTINENERLEKQQSAYDITAKRHTSNEAQLNVPLPSEQDFRLLQDRLEQIVSDVNFAQKKVQLKEDREFEFILPARDKKFLSVAVRARPTPLKVVIKRSRGKLLVFSSKSNAEPSKQDTHHLTDSFSIGETGSKFKSEQVYIGLEALQECLFTIKVVFGRSTLPLRGSVSAAKIKEAESLARNELNRRVEEAYMRRAYEAKHAVLDKNYISANIKLARSVSTLKKETMLSQIQRHQKRSEMAQEKKHELLSQKRLKTIQSLNRHIIRTQEEKKAKELLSIKLQLQNWQKLWVTQTVVAKALQTIHAKFVEARIKQEDSKKQGIAVIRIQLMFKRRRGDLTEDELPLVRAVDSLLFYQKHAQLQRRKASKQIQLCVWESATNSAVPDSVGSFFRRGKA
jgi:hypothetical protein